MADSDRFDVRFVSGAAMTSFDRHELLWWSPVESSPPAPFANFGHHAHPGRNLARTRPDAPWGILDAAMREAHKADYSRCSAAAMRALVEAARLGVPRGWRKAVLEIKVSYELPAERYKVTHRLSHPDTGAEAMDFSDALFASIEVFHRIAAEAGQNWNRSTLTLHLDGNGRCTEAEATYDYGTNFGSR